MRCNATSAAPGTFSPTGCTSSSRRGIFRRERYQERPERYEYRLTERGLDLWPVLVTLMTWGEKHGGSADGPVVALRHTACGKVIDPVLRCPACDEDLDARAVRAVPGPAALARTA